MADAENLLLQYPAPLASSAESPQRRARVFSCDEEGRPAGHPRAGSGASASHSPDAIRRQFSPASVADLPDLTERIQSMGLYEEYQRFRAGYLAFRAGGHRGAKGEHTAEVLQARAEVTKFETFYPTYSAWMYRRTMSYWIAVFFAEGSWLFTIGSFFLCFPKMQGIPHIKALTLWPTLLAGVMFSAGAYMMCLETAKLLGSERRSEWNPFVGRQMFYPEDPETSRWPYFASLSYLVGTLIFPIGMIASCYDGLSDLQTSLLITWPYIFGGVFFAMAGLFECLEQGIFRSACCWKLPQWSALGNFCGGSLFLVGAFLTLVDMDVPSAQAYTVGSAIFVLSSVTDIWLWRDAQFGLTFLSALNKFKSKNGLPPLPVRRGSQSPPGSPQSATPRVPGAVSNSSSDSAHSRAASHEQALPQFSWRGFVFINIYCLICAVSTVNFCMEVFHFSTMPNLFNFTRMVNEILPLVLVSAVQIVHSAVVETPKSQPWHMLIMFARVFALMIGANACVCFYVLVAPGDPGGIPNPPRPPPPGLWRETSEMPLV